MREIRRGEALSFREQEETLLLLREVKATQTLNGRVPLYANALVTLQQAEPRELFPTAKYVLTDNISKVGSIRRSLLTEGVDILRLRGIHRTDGIVIAPPIVEISDGVPAIVDGIHRCELARRMNVPITVVLVDGASLPIISYPVSWRQVREYRVKPERPELLRDLREGIADTSQDLTRFYRDFSHLGSGGRRPRLGQVA